MGIDQRVENRRMARVVEERAGVGPTEIVSSWQTVIVDLLCRMKPFLMPGVTVTFQHLAPSEIIFFERLKNEVRIPQSAAAIYLPPSVRKQMLGEKQVINDDSRQPDAGVVVASHHDDFDVIVNVLFALHPFTPAIDLYDRGQLIAGYQFKSIDACIAELSTVLNRHLGMPSPKS
ncbi:MAG: hypothetical protein WAK95_08090 [Desulfobacterales bacterium]